MIIYFSNINVFKIAILWDFIKITLLVWNVTRTVLLVMGQIPISVVKNLQTKTFSAISLVRIALELILTSVINVLQIECSLNIKMLIMENAIVQVNIS
jgi:hypothetical protein